jgi:hypothetical protein
VSEENESTPAFAIYSSDGKETTVKGNEQLAKMLQLTTVPEEGAS